jgi:predicted MFS family arabinose efflux permease
MVWRSLRELPVWLRVFTLGRLIKSAGSLAWLYLAVYLVQSRGLDPSTAGLIAGANGVGVIAGSVCGGWVGDRFGIRRTMIVAHLGSAFCAVLVPLAPLVLLGPLFAGWGFIGAMAFPLGMALITGSLPATQRRAGAALARAAMNAGVVIGPPLGALAAAYSFSLIFVMEAAAGIFMAVLIWRFVPSPPPRSLDRPSTGLWRALKADRPMWMLLVAVMFVDAAYRQIFTALPLTLTAAGSPLIGFGVLISLSSVVIVLAETPLAIKLAGRPAMRVIPLGYVCIALGFAVLILWPGYGGALLAIGVITVGEMLYKPTSAAFAADRSPPGMQGRYQGLYSSASIAGTVISPPVGGALYQYAPSILWPTCAALATLGATALFLTTRRTPAPPATVSPTLAPATLPARGAEAAIPMPAPRPGGAHDAAFSGDGARGEGTALALAAIPGPTTTEGAALAPAALPSPGTEALVAMPAPAEGAALALAALPARGAEAAIPMPAPRPGGAHDAAFSGDGARGDCGKPQDPGNCANLGPDNDSFPDPVVTLRRPEGPKQPSYVDDRVPRQTRRRLAGSARLFRGPAERVPPEV